jgi:glycosyltransferase involved in cell wall biosynthesis
MRVLHVATRHRRGGAERNVAFTIGWELAQGHEVHLAVGPDHVEAELPDGAKVHVIPHLVRQVAFVQDLRALLELRNLMRRYRFDIVHTHQSKAGILGRLAARGRVAVVLHTIHMASFGPAYSFMASQAFRYAERVCASWSTRIISVGRELIDMYRAAGIGRANQYVLLRSPIDLSEFARLRSTSTAERDAARVRLGLRAATPVALVLASLEPRKRVDLIFAALQGRIDAGACQVLVCGEGVERQNLEERARSLGIGEHVVFAGHVDDVVEAFRAADVLVHAATVEGVPQVVVQAFAAGLPVAATDMMGLREVDGAPIEIASATAEDLGLAVERVMSSPGKQLPLDDLEPWAPRSVSDGLNRLYSTLPTAAP